MAGYARHDLIDALVRIGLVGGMLVAVLAWDLGPVRRRARSPWPAIAVALALPFVLPVAWIWARIVATVLSITLSCKSWSLARGTALDPNMLATTGRALVWLIWPPESRWPAHDGAAARARRLARGAIKLPAIAALLVLEHLHPVVHADPWRESGWALVLCWLAMSAIADLVTAPVMLAGVDVVETFDTPPVSSSPREFWARRWNLFVAGFLARHVFAQLGGRRHPLRATVLVFVASGAMHEWFLFAALGHPSARLGWMLAFFTLHGLAVAAQMALDRRLGRRRRRLPRPLAVALHLAWFTATAPLFFTPLGELFFAWPW